jgi:transposase, IS4 family
VRTLAAALGYRGRALPLAWVRWPAQQPHPQASWTDCQTLLAQAAAILPAGPSVTALADRAFGCPAFTDLAAAHGWQ